MTSKLEYGLAGTKGMSLHNPSLTITFASLRDSGRYTCIASNSIGTGKSKSANITVHGGNYNKCTMQIKYTLSTAYRKTCNNEILYQAFHQIHQMEKKDMQTIDKENIFFYYFTYI